jgi:excisionase family DNA binding protein
VDDRGAEWSGSPDAAKYLGISQRTLYRLIDSGELVAYELGRVIRVRRADIDTFIEQWLSSSTVPPLRAELARLAVTGDSPADRPVSRQSRVSSRGVMVSGQHWP